MKYPLDGWMAEIQAESSFPFAVGRRRFSISVRARHARSIRVDGTSNDTDWDSLGVTSDYSESDCRADIIMWDVDAAFSIRVFQQRMPLALDIGVVAGYGTQRFKFTDRNLHTMIWDHQETDQRDTGVVSYYTTTSHTGRVGLFLDVHTHRRLRCRVEAAYVPYLRAKADALWVLRNYPFWQKADGRGYTLKLRADYTVWRRLSLFTGLRRVSLVADRHAVEGGVLDGTPYEDEPYVSEITSRYSGVEVGGTLRF